MTDSIPAALRVERLSKSYGDYEALHNVSFTVARGERVGLMGPSGSGKSTLLNCIGGIDRADSGSIQIAGQALEKLSGEELARLRRGPVSTVFQFFHLLPTLTVAENIEFPLQLQGISPKERFDRVDELVAEVGLRHRCTSLPTELSGGEMQRVAVARALVTRPDLILADEPTGNLDSANGAAALDLLERLTEQRQTALILVTHSEEATRICRRVLRLKDGKLKDSDES